MLLITITRYLLNLVSNNRMQKITEKVIPYHPSVFCLIDITLTIITKKQLVICDIQRTLLLFTSKISFD